MRLLFFLSSDGFWFTKPRWKALPNVKREAAAKGKKYSTYKPISFLLLHSSCMSYSFCSRFSHEEQWDHCLPTPTQHRQYVETRRKRREKTHTVSYMHNHKPCTTLERGVYTHLHTRMNHLYCHWPLERKAVRESLRRPRRKKVGSRLFFPLPYTSQTFSNVLLAAVDVWLTKEGKHWKHSAEKQWQSVRRKEEAVTERKISTYSGFI